MKRKVRVKLQAETEVDIEVDVDEGDDPTDLTPEDERAALALVSSFADWEVVDAVELTS